MFDDSIDRSDWNTISAAAQKRLDEAKKLFDDFVEKNKNVQVKEYTRILEPSCHLTVETWKLFRKHVLDAGFEAKRVKATEEQKKELKEKKKSAVYFVDVRQKKGDSKDDSEESKSSKKRSVPSEKPKRSKRSKKEESDEE